jgi:Yip1 domain
MESEAIDLNQEKKPRAHFGHVIGVITAPGKTFSHVIDAGHAWIYPFILISIIMLFGIFLENTTIQREAFETLPLGVNGSINMEVIFIISLIITSIFTPIIIFLVLYMIPALIYLFFGNFIFEKKIKFRQTLNIAAYSGVPFIVGSLVGTFMVGLGGNANISFSPAAFLPIEMHHAFIGMWLGIFDLFAIWQIFLAITGLSILFQHTKMKVASWLIPLYLVVYTFAIMMLSFMRNFVSEWGVA